MIYKDIRIFIIIFLLTGSALPVVAQVLAVRVSVVKPERMTIRRSTDQPGQVEAIETAPMYGKLAGYVQVVSVDIGDLVKKGQVLAELRMPEILVDRKQKRAEVRQSQAVRAQFEAAVLVAKAGVTTAQAKMREVFSGIKRAEAEVSRWQLEMVRVELLHRERALTGSLLDETRSKLNAAEAGRDEVKAHAHSAEAGLEEAKATVVKSQADALAAAAKIEVAEFEAEHADVMAEYAKIIAPFDGIVTKRNIDTGHLTTAGTTGEPLFVVSRSDMVTVTVGVPETEAPFVDLGDPARVKVQALGGKVFEGKVARIAWALDHATRTLRAEIDLPNPGNTIRPGLYAYVTIISEAHVDVLTVPTSAVVLGDLGKAYCVIVVDGVARRKEVKTGLTEGKRIEIISGIGADDAVVGDGVGSLDDGQSIERIESPAPAMKPKS